jgi:hypothetical protein
VSECVNAFETLFLSSGLGAFGSFHPRTHALISLAASIPLDIYLRERESRKGDELLITYLRSLHGCLCRRASSMDIQKKAAYIPLALRARESGARSFPSHLKSHQPLILNKRKKSLRPCIRNSFAPPADSIKRRAAPARKRFGNCENMDARSSADGIFNERERKRRSDTPSMYIDGLLSAKVKLKHAGSFSYAFLIVKLYFCFQSKQVTLN